MSRVGAKSFIQLDEQGLVSGIVEKDVSSNFVSSGLYAFAQAGQFALWFRSLQGAPRLGEIFVSHVLAEGLRQGEVFRPHFIDKFIDVGTLKDWRDFIAAKRVLLVDIDGVVFQNQSQYFRPYWGEPVSPIEANVAHLRRLQSEGAQLVFVTSRPETYRAATAQVLQAAGSRHTRW
jgi:hypothetical protein